MAMSFDSVQIVGRKYFRENAILADTPDWAKRIENKLDKLINHVTILTNQLNNGNQERINQTIYVEKLKKKRLCHFHVMFGAKAKQPCNGPCVFRNTGHVSRSMQENVVDSKLANKQIGAEIEAHVSETCSNILHYIRTTMPKFVSPIGENREKPKEHPIYRVGLIPELQEVKAEAETSKEKFEKSKPKLRKTVIRVNLRSQT